MTRGREVHLASRPHGEPTSDNFRLVETDVRSPDEGEVLVRNAFVSVDPYMRGRMNDVKSYVPPFQLDQAMEGAAVGEVVESRAPQLAVGDTVLHMKGWREYATGKAAEFRKVDPSIAAPSQYLGVLGTTGFTAWIGLVDIAELKQDDVVFVSGAAGAVGSVAGQIAKLRDAARVVGSAGSDEKVRYLLDELGFDAAFNYRSAPVRDQLRDAAPDGIDVYFDNVGGDHLEAAITSLHNHGRVALCGAISQYNITEPPAGPRNLGLAVTKRLTLRGYIIIDHMDRYRDFMSEVGPWVAAGRIRTRETIVDGIENATDAFIGLMHGDNVGKMLVRTHPA